MGSSSWKKELTVGPVRRHSQQEQDTLPCFQAVVPEKIQAKKSKGFHVQLPAGP